MLRSDFEPPRTRWPASRRRPAPISKQVAAIRRQFLDYFAGVANDHASRRWCPPTIRRCCSPTAAWSSRGLPRTDRRPLSARRRRARCLRAGGKHTISKRGLHGASPTRSSRCWGLVFRRLLQARSDPVRMGASDGDLTASGDSSGSPYIRPTTKPTRRMVYRHRVPRERVVRIATTRARRMPRTTSGRCRYRSLGPCSEIFYRPRA